MAFIVGVFDKQTGDMITVLRGSDDAMLPLNWDEATQQIVHLAWDHPAARPAGAWRLRDGILEEVVDTRPRVVLTVDKPRITGDGVDEACVTLTGLLADSTVSVTPGGTLAVPMADPVLVLTGDIPQRFTVRVVDAQYQSEPLNVEAV